MRMCAEFLVNVPMLTSAEQMQVKIAQLWGNKSVGIIFATTLIKLIAPFNFIKFVNLVCCSNPFKNIRSFNSLHRNTRLLEEQRRLIGTREKSTNKRII